jgi:hypothetical protein
MMNRSYRHLVTLGLLVGSGVLACSSKSPTNPDDLEGAPEVAAVQMPLTGNAASEGTTTEADAIESATLTADELDQTEVPATTDAVELSQLRGEAKRLNDSIRDFLGPVAAMIRDVPPSRQVGDIRMWGPVTRGVTEFRFFLKRMATHEWGWRLDARYADSGETYSHVAAGEIKVGAKLRRGAGIMGFDIDALGAVDPTVTAQGRILVGFRHGELGTTVGYAVTDFSRNPATQPPVDALLRAVHLKDGFNSVRLGYHGDVEGTATGAEELVLARVRHQRGVGGRSDMLVLEGDVPAGQAWVVSNCWNKQLNSGFREVRTCPFDGLLGASCVVTETKGDPSACPASLLTAELPPTDPTAAVADDSDPNGDVAAPADMPTVDGDATGS